MISVGIAGTLMGAIIFQMTLFFLINHDDEDIRKAAYNVICSTISIFCAVLIFQSVNDGVTNLLLDEFSSTRMRLTVSFAHMLVWFCLMQLSLALISGAIGEPPE